MPAAYGRITSGFDGTMALPKGSRIIKNTCSSLRRDVFPVNRVYTVIFRQKTCIFKKG